MSATAAARTEGRHSPNAARFVAEPAGSPSLPSAWRRSSCRDGRLQARIFRTPRQHRDKGSSVQDKVAHIDLEHLVRYRDVDRYVGHFSISKIEELGQVPVVADQTDVGVDRPSSRCQTTPPITLVNSTTGRPFHIAHHLTWPRCPASRFVARRHINAARDSRGCRNARLAHSRNLVIYSFAREPPPQH
jgi:hypothetical protein